MFRIIIYIIFIIISLLMPDSRYNRYSRMYGRRRYNRALNFFEDEDDTQQSFSQRIANKIEASIRRRKALKHCQKFLRKDKYVITLRNQNILIIFDTKNKTLCCMDNKVKGRSATVVWLEQVEATADLIFGSANNLFETTFDEICYSFTERANYTGTVDVLRTRFKRIQETNPPQKIKPQPVQEAPIKLTVQANKRVDLNAADEQTLAKLPGISIIIAKKIIKYRVEHNGFKTLEEFYREMKIKPHFQTQLNDLVCIYRAKNTQKTADDERIIDF